MQPSATCDNQNEGSAGREHPVVAAAGLVAAGADVDPRANTVLAPDSPVRAARSGPPTLRSRSKSKLRAGVGCVYEIVINGLTAAAISGAMRTAIGAACESDIIAVSAGNYGGKLGKFHFKLRELLA